MLCNILRVKSQLKYQIGRITYRLGERVNVWKCVTDGWSGGLESVRLNALVDTLLAMLTG